MSSCSTYETQVKIAFHDLARGDIQPHRVKKWDKWRVLVAGLLKHRLTLPTAGYTRIVAEKEEWTTVRISLPGKDIIQRTVVHSIEWTIQIPEEPFLTERTTYTSTH